MHVLITEEQHSIDMFSTSLFFLARVKLQYTTTEARVYKEVDKRVSNIVHKNHIEPEPIPHKFLPAYLDPVSIESLLSLYGQNGCI